LNGNKGEEQDDARQTDPVFVSTKNVLNMIDSHTETQRHRDRETQREKEKERERETQKEKRSV